MPLCVPKDEMPSVSRMREIRTSGLKRGEGRLAFLLYSTVKCFRLGINQSVADGLILLGKQ